VAATRKCQKYSELSTAYLFLPIAVEALGLMNDSVPVCEFFVMLGHKITDTSGDSQQVPFLFQRLHASPLIAFVQRWRLIVCS